MLAMRQQSLNDGYSKVVFPFDPSNWDAAKLYFSLGSVVMEYIEKLYTPNSDCVISHWFLENERTENIINGDYDKRRVDQELKWEDIQMFTPQSPVKDVKEISDNHFLLAVPKQSQDMAEPFKTALKRGFVVTRAVELAGENYYYFENSKSFQHKGAVLADESCIDAIAYLELALEADPYNSEAEQVLKRVIRRNARCKRWLQK